jgi:hypothetical protein
MKTIINTATLIATLFMVISCGSGEKYAKEVSYDPLEVMKAKFGAMNYSVVLDDMTIDETGDYFVHKHKYQILKLSEDTLESFKLDWIEVNQAFFKKYEHDLGMEIFSHHDGKYNKTPQPVGYGWAIGNEKHGEWVKDTTAVAGNSSSTDTSNGGRVWRTATSSPFFWLWAASAGRNAISSNGFSNYNRSMNSSKPYYGFSGGKYAYGTRSEEQQATRSHFYARRAGSAAWSSLGKKKTRSTSRYSGGSSTRSRSGGFGK